MSKGKIFNNQNLNTVKQVVWQESVLPYIFRKNTNTAQKVLFWVAEHTLAGISIGMLSIGAIGVLAWETTKNIEQYPYVTEVAFKKADSNSNTAKSNTREKIYTKGSFQPIVVETDETLQPLEKITSGKIKTQTTTLK
jgi:hypothetical protein